VGVNQYSLGILLN